MPINIKGGQPNVVHAKVTANIADIGINETNTVKLTLVDAIIGSYKPDQEINSFDQIVEGNGYYFEAKLDMDLSEYFYPPFPTGGGGNSNTIVGEDGTPIIPE